MPCPLCKDNRADYSYSGADIFGDQTQIPGRSCGLSYETEYPKNRFPKVELSVCDTCSAVWRLEYYFTDRPPLMISGKVLKDREEQTATAREILTTLDENLKVGTVQQKEFAESTACLTKFL